MGKIRLTKNHGVYNLLSKYTHMDVRQSDICGNMLTTGKVSWHRGVWKLYYFQLFCKFDLLKIS